ncbi:MAG: N-acetylmuramoyl-L-alanine amidase [Saprospiraceae bacterium]|jgi:hypothetical protein|nr:N-acetylmuramoyl-L-alanine amidase [Saprospiraceae bacterium]
MRNLSVLLFICLSVELYSQHWSKTIPFQWDGSQEKVIIQTIDLSGLFVGDFIGVSFYLEGKDVSPLTIQASFTTKKLYRQVLPFGDDPDQKNRFVSELLYLKPDEAGKCLLQLTLSEHISAHVTGAIRVFVPQMEASINEHIIKKASPRHFVCPCPQPDYVPRTSWGVGFRLNGDIFIGPPVYTKVTHLIVHHSAGTNVSNNWAGVVAAIFDFHVNTNKWSDVGYNWLIDPNGVIYEGRGGGDNVRGAHMCGYNNNSMAACLLGNFEVAQPTDAMVAALTRLFSWKACKENITPEGSSAIVSHTGFMQHISGHQDGCSPNYTQCPGQNLYVKLPGLRTTTKKYIDETCSSISASDDIFINRTIKIIPNPAGDNISIKNDNDSVIEQLKITDITGRIIISPTPSSHVIDISALKPGTYTLMAVTNSRLKVGKFVKI